LAQRFFALLRRGKSACGCGQGVKKKEQGSQKIVNQQEITLKKDDKQQRTSGARRLESCI
jgi:hypothetical protein